MLHQWIGRAIDRGLEYDDDIVVPRQPLHSTADINGAMGFLRIA